MENSACNLYFSDNLATNLTCDKTTHSVTENFNQIFIKSLQKFKKFHAVEHKSRTRVKKKTVL